MRKRKESSSQCSGAEDSAESRTRKVSSSGGEHPAETFTIVFADIGEIDRRSPMVFVPREHTLPSEVEEFAEEFDADVTVHPSTLSVDDVEWNLKVKQNITMSPFRKIQLGPCHTAQSTILRRLTPCSDELELILVRILKGKVGLSRLYYSTLNRKLVAFAIFNLLQKATRPTMILGNPGFSLSQIARMCSEYKDETGQDMQRHMQVLLSRDQQLICFHSGVDNAKRVDASAPDRIFIVQLCSNSAHSGATSSASSSSSSSGSQETLLKPY